MTSLVRGEESPRPLDFVVFGLQTCLQLPEGLANGLKAVVGASMESHEGKNAFLVGQDFILLGRIYRM